MIRTRHSARENNYTVKFPKETLTQQHMEGETNINTIIRKYARTGIKPVNKMNPSYGDFSGIEDYHSSLRKLDELHSEFRGMPAHIKKRFHQDPGEILDFLSNSENLDEAVKLGLVEKPIKAEPIEVGKIVEDEIKPVDTDKAPL